MTCEKVPNLNGDSGPKNPVFLNLKPLQNDLDRIAKNMIEDALNYAFEFDPTDQILQTVDDVLEADCPGKRAQIG